MPTDNWKNFERSVAAHFGGKRTGAMGDNKLRQSCDVITDTLLIECKLRAKWPTPKQIGDWMDKATKRAVPSLLMPVLCIKIGGQHGFWIVVWSKLTLTQSKDMRPTAPLFEHKGNLIMQHVSWTETKE